MKPEFLEKLDRIFHSALELPVERRAAFLDQACANDSNLRSEVESLISSHELSGNFIDGNAADVALEVDLRLAQRQLVSTAHPRADRHDDERP